MKILRALSVLLFILVAAATGALGKGAAPKVPKSPKSPTAPPIATDAADTTVRLKGWLDPGAAFVRSFTVTTNGGGRGPISFQASDLVHANGIDVIGRAHVSVAGDTSAGPNVPAIFEIAITDVKAAGVYEGTLDVRRGAGPGLRLKLVLEAVARPALTVPAGYEHQHLKLVRTTAFPGWLAWLSWPVDAISPAGERANSYVMRLLKARRSRAAVTGVTVLLRDEGTGRSLSSGVDARPDAGAWPAAGTDESSIAIPLRLTRDAIPPGHYSGTVLVDVADADEPVAVPLDVSVKDGPLGVLLVLFASVVVGRLYKYMQDRGNQLADALAAIRALRARVARRSEAARDVLDPQLDAVRDMLTSGEASDALERAKRIAKHLEMLILVEQGEAQVAGIPNHQGAAAVHSRASALRTAMVADDDDAIAKAYDEFVGALRDTVPVAEETSGGRLAGAQVRVVRGSALRDLRNRFAPPGPEDNNLQSGDSWWNTYVAKPVSFLVRVLKHFVWRFVGIGYTLRAESLAWVVRPLVWLVVLLALCALGFKSLYVDNPVFGTNAVADYLTLFFWGVSADVASRSLGNLGAKPAALPE